MADNILEIPEGTILQMAEDGLVLGHRGDVVIRGDLGHRLKKVYSETGSVELAAPATLQVDVVEAKKGKVVINGRVMAKSITAEHISMTSGMLEAKSIMGEASVSLVAGELAVDLLMSPEVTITPEVKGRCTVIESRNDLGPHQLKGAFRLAEFMELVPSAQKVIQMEADRLPSLTAGSPPPAPAPSASESSPVMEAEFKESAPAEPEPVAEQAPDPSDVVHESAWPDPGTGEGDWGSAGAPPSSSPADEPTNVQGPSPAAPRIPTPPPSPPTLPDPEPVSAAPPPPPPPPPALESDPEPTPPEPAAAPAPPPPAPESDDPPFHPALLEAVEAIQSIYVAWPDGDVPSAVDRLRAMVETGLYAELKVQLTALWRQIIAYHSKTGTKIPNLQVQQMFRQIQRTLAENV